MSLVSAEYGNSSSEASDDEDGNEASAPPSLGPIPPARRERLPVPEAIAARPDSKADSERGPADDPSLHGGRARSFAHERGNWATHAFAPVPERLLASLRSALRARCHFADVELENSDDFHVSLSRTLVLKYHWIGAFDSSLRDAFGKFRSFRVRFESLGAYTNDNGTRTFLGLKVGRLGEEELTRAIAGVDRAVAEFRLEPFYEERSLHASILWCNGNKKSLLEDILPDLEEVLEEFASTHAEEDPLSVDIEAFACKCGNKLFKYPLS